MSAPDQQAAQALFEEGNEWLKDSVFVDASRLYRRALQHWDHPAIHYNLALALMNLDQPIEVHKHLAAAVLHGPGPLEASRFEHALGYKALIEKQLARVEVTCALPGATVTMNGQTLFVAPGRFQGLVRPGVHSILARKEGYLPTDVSRTVMPGEKVSLDLKLYLPDEAIQYRRRWSQWLPWTVLGAGLTVTTGGAFLHSKADDRFQAFDSAAVTCGGCMPSPAMGSLRSRGETLQTTAVVGYAVGGAALVTGTVLLYLNRPQSYRVQPDVPALPVALTPTVGAGSGGVVGTFRF
ncbi:hypothetical protein ACLESO_26485 [Pyxidicoccus sp. 3LG]